MGVMNGLQAGGSWPGRAVGERLLIAPPPRGRYSLALLQKPYRVCA